MTRTPTSAVSYGLLSCHTCGMLSKSSPHTHSQHCPRCDATLHTRKPDSITRSWALLLASIICYIPANLLPMMLTTTPFGTESDTIMSGVVYFWTTGSWYLALIIFTASILVPLMKMMALMLLLITTQKRSCWQPEQRARLYRLVEIVGRWSMLDIFVVAIMVALVQLHGLATILPGPGAIAFAAVVVLTMLAAMAFDPRLMWDSIEENEKNQK